MDKKQLEERLNAVYLKNARSVHVVEKRSNFSKTKDGKIGDILKQRHGQRSSLFWFALTFVTITTVCVFTAIGLQAYLNFHGYARQLVDPRTLQIVVGGVFIQFIGLVGIITRSIWNDKPYLDAGLIKEKRR